MASQTYKRLNLLEGIQDLNPFTSRNHIILILRQNHRPVLLFQLSIAFHKISSFLEQSKNFSERSAPIWSRIGKRQQDGREFLWLPIQFIWLFSMTLQIFYKRNQVHSVAILVFAVFLGLRSRIVPNIRDLIGPILKKTSLPENNASCTSKALSH